MDDTKDKYIHMNEYAEEHDRTPSIIRHRIEIGLHPEAMKVEDDQWLLPKDAPYRDARFKRDPKE